MNVALLYDNRPHCRYTDFRFVLPPAFMKLTIPLSAVVALSLVTQASAAAVTMITRYGFDESNGMIAIDATGKTGDATFVSGAERSDDVPGTGIANHTSLSLNGTEYLSAPHIGFDNRSFTVAAWLKTTDMSMDQVWLSQGDSIQTDKDLALRLTKKGALQFSFKNDDMSTADNVFTANTWHHATFTFDSKTRQRRIYVDGAMQATGTASGVYLGTTGLTDIGRNNVQPFGAEFWHGNIDEVTVFDSVLGGDDIAAMAVQSMARSSSSSKRRMSSSSSSSAVRAPFRERLTLSQRKLMRLANRKVPVAAPSSSSAMSRSAWSVRSVQSSSTATVSSVSSASSVSSKASVAVPVSSEGMLYRVTSYQLHLRKDSRATAVNIMTLMPHDPLYVLEMLKNGWAKVKTPNGVYGYVNASFIEKAE